MKKALLLFLVIVAIGTGACRSQAGLCLNGGSSHCDRVISDFVVSNPRFALPSPMSTTTAANYWLRAGDGLDAAWSSFTLYMATPGTVCNASSAISPPSCEKCDLVLLNSGECPDTFVPTGVDFMTVSSQPGFSMSAPTTTVGHINTQQSVGFGAFEWTPGENATVDLTTTIADRGNLAESKVFVLTDGMSQPVTYALDRHDNGAVVAFRGSVPFDPVLEDNFSTNLRIGRVRILKGTPDSDPERGGRFRLKDASVVKPSRLELIPTRRGVGVFADDTYRCYSDSSTDGDIDLTRCRYSFGSTVTTLQDTTPTNLKSVPGSDLTWAAEFNVGEGGVPPALAPGEILVIEFTIHAN